MLNPNDDPSSADYEIGTARIRARNEALRDHLELLKQIKMLVDPDAVVAGELLTKD